MPPTVARPVCARQSRSASNHLFSFWIIKKKKKIQQLILIIQGGDCWRLWGSRHRFCIEWLSSVKNTSCCGGVMFHPRPVNQPCDHPRRRFLLTSTLCVDAVLKCALNVNNVTRACKVQVRECVLWVWSGGCVQEKLGSSSYLSFIVIILKIHCKSLNVSPCVFLSLQIMTMCGLYRSK